MIQSLIFIFCISPIVLVLFAHYLFARKEWNSELRLIFGLRQLMLLLWLGYFLVQWLKETPLFANLVTYLVTVANTHHFGIPFKPIAVLLAATIVWIMVEGAYSVCKHNTPYARLSGKNFPEYDFEFQDELVKFLNKTPEIGQNIYWLDGSWGSGKTHFLRTFFHQQRIKKAPIYYVSCFGITTREQAEKVLVSEIEQNSAYSLLDNIPVINGLVKLTFKVFGLDVIKKDSVIIFDDLERVTYSEPPKKNSNESSDKPQDYNDLLGFIDFLANHQNKKVIVVYDASNIQKTQTEVIGTKFGARSSHFLSGEEVIDKIIAQHYVGNEAFGEFLAAIYKLRLSYKPQNLRHFISEIRNLNPSEISSDFVLKYLNGKIKHHDDLIASQFYDFDSQMDLESSIQNRKYKYIEKNVYFELKLSNF